MTDIYDYTDSNWKDKLTSFNGNEITYDEIGNPLNYYNGLNFDWQNGRQLANVSGNGFNISYTYNSDGIRTSKTVNGVITTYTLEGGNIIKETNGTDTIWYYYDASGTLTGFELNGTPYFYVKNIQGDITAITDANGNIVVEYVYDSWGKLISITGTLADTVGIKNSYRYRGYYYDTETSLYYLNSRYYDSSTRRFINCDFRINNSQGVLGGNTFSYCINNPIALTDKEGTKPYELFDTPLEAAADFARTYNGVSIKENREYASVIYGVQVLSIKVEFVGFLMIFSTTMIIKGYYYTAPWVGGEKGSLPNPFTYIPGSILVSKIHTHGAYNPQLNEGNDIFSTKNDIYYADKFNMSIYMVNPKGELLLYVPGDPQEGRRMSIEDIPFDPNHP